MTPALRIDPQSPVPLYAQLEQAIREAAISGRVAVGGQLPTVRQLAVELRINANTVAKVYADLERDGLLETRRGVGTFLAKLPKPASKRDREKRLAEFVSATLADAQRAGITLEELILSLQSKKSG